MSDDDNRNWCRDLILEFLQAKARLDYSKETYPSLYQEALEGLVGREYLANTEEFKKLLESEPEA